LRFTRPYIFDPQLGRLPGQGQRTQPGHLVITFWLTYNRNTPIFFSSKCAFYQFNLFQLKKSKESYFTGLLKIIAYNPEENIIVEGKYDAIKNRLSNTTSSLTDAEHDLIATKKQLAESEQK